MARINEVTEVELTEEEVREISEGGEVTLSIAGRDVALSAASATLPEPGDRLFDQERRCYVEVEHVIGSSAKDTPITIDGRRTTVAAENPRYDEHSPVIAGTYPGSDDLYYIPLDRLE